MFRRDYYYLVAGLPDIILDQKKLIFTIDAFKNEMQYHLHPNDYKLVELLFLPVDNRNLLNIVLKKGKPFEERGKYMLEELEQDFKEPGNTEKYIQNFITAFKSDTPVFEKLSWEDQLTWLYYDYVRNCENEFLRKWFDFDLNLKNIVAGINVRKHKLNGEKIYIGDSFIVQAVKKSTLKDFGLSNDFEYMEKLLIIQENENFLEREKAMDILRWNFLDEQNTFNYFSIEVLLAYIIKLNIIERWLVLDKETGESMFRKLLNDLEKSYEFPKEFTINERRNESNQG